MTLLVLGATGMLGHKLMQTLASRFEMVGTVRGDAGEWASHPVMRGMALVGGVRVESWDSVIRAFESARPSAVVNGIGIIKQLPAAKAPIPSLEINSLLPHRLAQLCRDQGARLIHISTDCVFSGRKGMYTEADVSDAEDLYGRTKFLGEVSEPGALTLRTSIIGRELGRRSGLLEWFIGQRGKTASGYARAIYSGFTTQALAGLIGDIVEKHRDLSGLWQAASEPISKFDLLERVNRALGLAVKLQRDEAFVCDRSLDGGRLRREIPWEPPTWNDMVAGLAADPTPYDRLFEGSTC